MSRRADPAVASAVRGVALALLGHPVDLVLDEPIDINDLPAADRLLVVLAPWIAARTLGIPGDLTIEDEHAARDLVQELAARDAGFDFQSAPEVLEASSRARRMLRPHAVVLGAILKLLRRQGSASVAEQAAAVVRVSPQFATLLVPAAEAAA